MALNASVTSAVSGTVIASVAYNTNIADLNGAENPNFTVAKQTASTQESGVCGNSYTNQVTGTAVGPMVNMKRTMTNTPTSIALTTVTNVNTTGVGVSNITTTGFWLNWQSGSNASTRYLATYQTSGN